MNNPKLQANKQQNKSNVGKGTVVRILMVLLALITVTVAIVFIMGSGGQSDDGVAYSATIEAGDKITPSLFTYGSDKQASFYEDVDTDELSRTPGTHTLKISVDGKIYVVSLTVKDTVAPSGSAIPMVFKMGTIPSASAMVKDIVDVTDVRVTFDHSPNMAVEGRQNVILKLIDEGGNVKTINSFVYITEDLKVPEWEIGVNFPEISDFSSSLKDVVYQNQSDFTDVLVPGDYLVALRITVANTSDTFYAPFKAVDTVAPVVKVKENYIYDIGGQMPLPQDLISEYIEHTQIKFEYLEQYSISEPGVYTLKVKASDVAGNYVIVNVTVTAYDGNVDNGAPIITITSKVDIFVGGSFNIADYITIYDDKDGDISISDESKVTVNDTSVNNMLPGSYYILVTATDSSGKVANATLTVNVSHIEVTDEMVDQAVDKFIEGIITDNMSTQEKISAVFNKITENNSTFKGSSDKKNDIKREAYYGLTFGYGDSYTVSSMVSVVLDRLNINSKLVERIGGKDSFYWNLVDFYDGWYHLDASHHDTGWVVDGVEKATFKLTDGQVAEYTSWYNLISEGTNYYKFNNSLYPSTPVLENGGYIYNPYRVIYGVSDGGFIEGNADQSIYHGKTTYTVKAVAASGYVFVKWSDGVETAERNDVIYGDMTVTAIFEQNSVVITKTYIFNYSADPGGSLKGVLRQSVKSGYYGSEVIAIPDVGYKFAGWSDGVTTPSRTDISQGNINVTAYFALDDGSNYTLEYKASLGGKIEGKTIQIVDIGMQGSVVTAVPSPGFIFNGWSDGVMSVTRSDVANSDISVTAYFVHEDAVLYNVVYSASAGGTINGVTTQRVVEGSSSSTVTAVAKRGYVFAGWSDGVSTTKRNDVVLKDMSVVALFVKLPEIYVSYKTDPSCGVIEGIVEQVIYNGEYTTEVTAVAKEGYKFVSWSDGVTTPTRSDNPAESIEVTAIFEQLEKFTFNYIAGEGGSIVGSASQIVYIGASGTEVVATPDVGYKFVSWSDGVTTAARSDIANGDIEVTASFVALKEYTVTYKAEAGGTISGIIVQTGYEGTSLQTVVAVPNEGYEFVSWSDGVTDAARTDVFSENAEFTAQFVPVKVCTIYYTATIGGTIEGEATQTMFIDERGSVVTAVAQEGYVFVQWSDGVKDASRSDVAVSALMTITAIFLIQG